jgi:hypothetical protein
MTPAQRRWHNKRLRYVGIDPRKLSDAQVGEAIRLIDRTIETSGNERRAAVRAVAAFAKRLGAAS